MTKKQKRIAIFGAGIAGKDILREIKKMRPQRITVVGFFDDNKKILHTRIEDIEVLGTRKQLPAIVRKKKIEEVIIAIPSAHGKEITNLVNVCSRCKVSFRIVPRVKEIIEGRVYFRDVRDVRVEDLLGRPVIKSNVEELKKFFRGKSILITGAAGTIGAELSRQIAAYKPKELMLLDWWENGIFQLQKELSKNYPLQTISYSITNIQDSQKIERVMTRCTPDVLFHAAAYKHVPLMEENIEEAVKNNIFGTLTVAKMAVKHNAKRFVLISTDKATNPVSVMGMTKLITEGIVKMLNGKTKFMSVRFGNVLDSFGSVIPTFRQQIKSGGPITITHRRMQRYFMTIPEATHLILQAAHLGNGGELFILDMGEPVKIIALAENLIRLSGLVPHKDIAIIYTGIRRGEKLSEELLSKKELLISTKKEKIFITQSFGLNIAKLPKSLIRLKHLLKRGDAVEIRNEFHNLTKVFPR